MMKKNVSFQEVELITSGFCCGKKQLLADQGGGRLSGLQRGLSSMSADYVAVNITLVNAAFVASAQRARDVFRNKQTQKQFN